MPWSTTAADRQALAQRSDWSGLSGLEQLWQPLARLYGDSPALDAPHARPAVRLSFRQLHQGIETAAAGFAALGVRPGEVVALFAENGPRWLLADQGLMRLGAADAVRGSAAPVEELRYILRDCGAVALVVESESLLEKLALASQPTGPLRLVVLLEGERGDAVAAATGTGPTLVSWAELLALGEAALASPGATTPWPAADPSRIATILYTSGTTGEPKGVPLSHVNLLHQLRCLGVAVQPNPGDRVVSVLPIWHAYERSAEYFLLSCGCQQTYTNLKQMRADLGRVRPQYLISVPRLWEALLGGFEDALAAMASRRQLLIRAALANSRAYYLRRRQGLDLTLVPEPPPQRLLAALEAGLRWPLHRLATALIWPQVRRQLVGGELRLAISGGGALAIHVDGFFEAIGIELLVGYGLTETSPVLTCRRRWANRRGSAGQPLPGTAIKVVDPDSRSPLPQGGRGLVLAKGPQVMASYLNKPEATAKVLDAEGWFDTGDLGYLLADGSLVLSGRAKDTIVLSSGENIEPGPLEECLVACSLVEQVMLVGQDRKSLGALVVPRPEALQAYARELGLRLPPHLAEPAQAPGTAPPINPAPDTAAPDTAALYKAITSRLNRRLAARPGGRAEERLAGVALVQPFSLENGLLTQTLKQRRDRIASRDAAAIDSIYAPRA
ncbi:MAG TPA: long-chain fatty acid--CoA ligase [Synechococcales bacterium UBA10510]|nr:long-chain fatty acid--CoA ligase [Synechococcales bacterium UBA10510]